MAKPKQIGRTMRAAHQLQLAGQGEMAMAIELIDVHTPTSGELSLLARRCLLLMLEAAAGDAWRAQKHKISKRDLRGNHKAMDRVRPALDELMGIWFSHAALLDGSAKGKKRFHLFKNIDDTDAESGTAFVEFLFDEDARRLLERSEVYARLSKEAIVRFQSRYSLRMYEVGAALYCKRDPSWTGSVQDLRRLLQIQSDSYGNFADLRRRVLIPAQHELNHLAEFTFDWKETTSGRQVTKVQLIFTPKPGRLALAAAEERDRHSAGRNARRAGTVEHNVEPERVAELVATATKRLAGNDLKWPADDEVTDFDPHTAELYKIAVDHGGGHAVSRLANAYVDQMGGKRFSLSSDRLRSSWLGHCVAKAAAWKPVA